MQLKHGSYPTPPSSHWSSDLAAQSIAEQESTLRVLASFVLEGGRPLSKYLFLFSLSLPVSRSGQHLRSLHSRVRNEIARLVAPDQLVYAHAAALFGQQASNPSAKHARPACSACCYAVCRYFFLRFKKKKEFALCMSRALSVSPVSPSPVCTRLSRVLLTVRRSSGSGLS